MKDFEYRMKPELKEVLQELWDQVQMEKFITVNAKEYDIGDSDARWVSKEDYAYDCGYGDGLKAAAKMFDKYIESDKAEQLANWALDQTGGDLAEAAELMSKYENN